MIHFFNMVTLNDKWYLCEDIRRHIWIMSGRQDSKACSMCCKNLPMDGRISICFIRNSCLCFECYHKSRWPKY